MIEIIISAVVALAIGVLIGILAVQRGKQKLITQVEVMKRSEEQSAEMHKIMMDAMKAEMRAEMTEWMGPATENMLKARQEEFSKTSKDNISAIVTPLEQSIKAMKEAMDKNSREQTEFGGQMKSQIEMMIRQSEAAKTSADELSRVFKHESKVQGDWGETVLKELLDSQGLTEGIHYDTQTSIRNAEGVAVRSEEGSLLRPDVILHLDTKREVIIDSKVSLKAFMDYVNSQDGGEKERYLAAHIESVEKHVKELSAKDYSSYIQPPKVKMDYVIMFVPHSGALWTALNRKPDLWRKAMDRNVYIADEQTLFAALKIINLTWTQIAQAENHKRVYELADEMLKRVGQFSKIMSDMGKAIQNAENAYGQGMDKLQDGRQSIIKTCEKLQKLGAKQNVNNPIPMLQVEEE